jgi:ABC-type branched-subunit amino acid transport system substrate-binding protein
VYCAATAPDLAGLAPRVFNRSVPNDDQLSAAGHDASFVEDLAAVRALYARYTGRFGALPAQTYRPFVGYCYDATAILLRAIEQSSSVGAGGGLVIDRDTLARAVRGTTEHAGVTGTITFAPNGDRLP